jgi:hypothetical protein
MARRSEGRLFPVQSTDPTPCIGCSPIPGAKRVGEWGGLAGGGLDVILEAGHYSPYTVK